MRHQTAAEANAHHLVLPRGWIILGTALASWMLVAGLWTALAGVFNVVSSSI